MILSSLFVADHRMSFPEGKRVVQKRACRRQETLACNRDCVDAGAARRARSIPDHVEVIYIDINRFPHLSCTKEQLSTMPIYRAGALH